jgi:hypothetical protein
MAKSKFHCVVLGWIKRKLAVFKKEKRICERRKEEKELAKKQQKKS